MKIFKSKKELLKFLVTGGFFLFIIYLSIWIRSSTINTPTVLDYDPFFFYRRAKMILENGFKQPEWDILSFYPPGRPFLSFNGWPYTIAFLYIFLNKIIPSLTFTKVAIISPLIIVALIPFPAFFLGKLLTKSNLGGLLVAFFSTLTPAFISVSMAGYCDSDAPVVFYSFLSTLSIFLLLKKRSILTYTFAIISNLLFIFNWPMGWITLELFTAFLPAFLIYRSIEGVVRGEFDLNKIFKEFKHITKPIIFVLVITNLVSYPLGLRTIVHAFLSAFSFTGIVGQPLIVNISVAELQPINIFTREGFNAVAGRVGFLPTVFTLFILPIIVLLKLLRKERVKFEEIFLFLWAFVAFYLISRGVRFSLLFSIASSVTSSYVVITLINYLKGRGHLLFSLVCGTIAFFSLSFLSNAIQLRYVGGMEVSKNWYNMLDWLKQNADKDSLIVTWWDPGHIIAGYTGLKVHADGAHCPPKHCIPYSHNARIQDMGRIFTTSDENEALGILRKYLNLTEEEKREVIEKFDGMVPEEAFKPVSEVYIIASADLIGKYYWMSFFGSCLREYGIQNAKSCYAMPLNWFRENAQGDSPYQISFSGYTREGFPTYSLGGGGSITLISREDKLAGVLNLPYQGIRNVIVRDIVYFENGVEKRVRYNVTNSFDGMLWVDPGFGTVILMDAFVRDSIFTNMFFFRGEGASEFNIKPLEHFELVHSTPETKVFKVIF